MENKKQRFVAFAFAAAETFFETDLEGKVLFQSGIPFSDRLVPADKSDLSGHSLLDIVHPDDHALFKVSIKMLRDGSGRIGPINVRIGGVNDYWRRIRLFGIVLPEAPDKLYLAVRSAGVSLAVPNADRSRDKKTGLLDKQAFTELAAQAVRSSRDAKVTMAKFKGLKKHKETASPDAHDQLLKTISSHISAMSLEGQTAAQVGDEEFAILHDKQTTQEQVLNVLAHVPGTDKMETAVSTVDSDAVDLSEREVIRAVSYTLDKFGAQDGDVSIKSLGSAYQKAYVETQEMIKNLKYALDRNTFNMAFQPIVRLSDRELHHYELLARPPENFHGKNIFEIIQFIEEIGMNEQFDFSMCSLAADFIQKNKKLDKYVALAVNLSGATIQRTDFVQRMLDKLRGFQGIEKRLAVEVTESSKILNLDNAAQSIKALRDAGYIVCLDDFGAGASGYQYLRELEVDYVKIDGIYIREMMEKKDAMAFVKSMVGLCKDLEIKTIAEYVEDEKQAKALMDLGVDYGQGWLFGAAESAPSYGPDAK